MILISYDKEHVKGKILQCGIYVLRLWLLVPIPAPASSFEIFFLNHLPDRIKAETDLQPAEQVTLSALTSEKEKLYYLFSYIENLQMEMPPMPNAPKSKSPEPNHRHDTHDHTHGAIDPSILSTQRGIWAIKWSFLGLITTALFQVIVVLLSGSVALLADTIHNFGDAATAVPLWIAFILARRKPSERFTYGYGRVEDLAGVAIVIIILLSAVLSGYESFNRFFHPQPVTYLWAVIIASIVGFIGNESVAQFRIKVGKEIGSAALIADGHHARVDGLTSLAVLFGAVGVWLGYPLADPIIGLIITAAIFRIVWDSAKSIFTRLLDGVDPEVVDEIRHTVNHTPGVCDIAEVRVRWLGHRLHAELNVAVSPELSVEEGHKIATEVRHQLLHHLRYLSNATIHIDPMNASGEKHHFITEHKHGDLPSHSH